MMTDIERNMRQRGEVTLLKDRTAARNRITRLTQARNALDSLIRNDENVVDAINKELARRLEEQDREWSWADDDE